MTVTASGRIIFTDWTTRGVFALNPSSQEVTPLITADENVRFAAFDESSVNARWVLAVMEDHRSENVENYVALIDSVEKSYSVLIRGSDFYSCPQFSPSGDAVCWVEWNHPDMPWTGSLLKVAAFDSKQGTLSGKAVLVKGQRRVESVSQPRWGFEGELFFACDEGGFYQLWVLEKGQEKARKIELKGLEEAEFAGPDWIMGR